MDAEQQEYSEEEKDVGVSCNSQECEDISQSRQVCLCALYLFTFGKGRLNPYSVFRYMSIDILSALGELSTQKALAHSVECTCNVYDNVCSAKFSKPRNLSDLTEERKNNNVGSFLLIRTA